MPHTAASRTRFMLRRALSALTATALLAGLLFGTPSAARAGTIYYVAHDGVSYSGACASADYSTDDAGNNSDDDAIMDAVTAADSFDTIHICAGTYQLDDSISVDFPLTFVGDGATKTILDGGARWELEDDGITPVFPFTEFGVSILRSNSDLSVEAIQFTGGAEWSGDCDGSASGGAICADGHLTVTDSAFVLNAANDFGGAIGAATVDISGSSFTGNVSPLGGALITQGGSISSTTFSGNGALSGGAIYYCSVEDLFISKSRFTNNLATEDGAGRGNGAAIFEYADSGVKLLSISASVFDRNVSDQNGTVTVRDAFVEVSNSTFTRNRAGRGAAVYSWGDGLSVTRSTFTKNATTSTWGGGAINAGRADVRFSTFMGNTAVERGGAMVLLYATGVMTRNTFTRNSAGNGGGAISICEVSSSAARKISGSNRFAGNRGKSSADRNIEAGWDCGPG